MASRNQFSEEEIKAIEQARKENKDKRAEAKLKVLQLRAEGQKAKEVAAATGFHAAYVTQLVAKYRDHGLEAISGNHYDGNHRNSRERSGDFGPISGTGGKRQNSRSQGNCRSISKHS